MRPDVINATFEAGGACFLGLNVRQIWRDKKLSGVHLFPTIWFNVWGAWNIYYYAALNQWLSWTAGIAVFLMNSTWVALALWFNMKAKNAVR